MTSATPASLGRPQSTELDRAILTATIEVLAEVGFDALSVAEVARRARSTTPAIYRRFTGKVELVIGALQHELARIEFDIPDQGSLRADLVAWVQLTAHALTPARQRIIAALFLASREHPGPAKSLIAAVQRAAMVAWQAILDRARDRGELVVSDESHNLISRVAPSFIMNNAMMLQPHGDRATLEQLADTILIPALRAAQEPLLRICRKDAQ